MRVVLTAITALEEGAPKWLALIGPRKIGKTSLLFEAARRSSRVGVAMVDAMEQAPLTLLNPARATRGLGLSLGKGAAIDNFLSWVDR